MIIKRYFRLLLLAPLMLGVCFVILNILLGDKISYAVGARIIFPYAFFCFALIGWCQRRTPGAIRRMVYRAPILFVLVLGLYLYAEYYFGLSAALTLIGLMSVLIMVGIFVIVFGYLYIFIAELSYVTTMQQHHRELSSKDRGRMSLHC